MVIDSIDVVFQEVPDEVSLCFSVKGCPVQCEGCHSAHLWSRNNGRQLDDDKYREILRSHVGLATCVLFLGGEWTPEQLTCKLKIAKSLGFKTCLYTGEEQVSLSIRNQLDFLKTGRWISQLGGLDSISTNQKFVNLKTGENLNYKFVSLKEAQ